jgi:protein gp37
MRMAARLQALGMAKYAGTTRRSGKRHVWTGRVNIDKAALTAPLAWKKPQRIFVNSMSDLFQDKADGFGYRSSAVDGYCRRTAHAMIATINLAERQGMSDLIPRT